MSLAAQVQAVTRTTKQHGKKHSVELEQTFTHDSASVWDALTSPDALIQWFDEVSGDLRPNGRFHLSGSMHAGSIKICQAPHTLEITWEYSEDESHILLTLTPTGSGTLLKLIHTVPAGERWDTFGPAATGVGWDGAFYALSLYLNGDSRSNPDEMAEINSSPEGLQFVTDVSKAWRNAHIASGENKDTAAQMAERTAAFYRGEDYTEA